jgi:gluconokinase
VIVIVMGVCGSGKTTIGALLAARLACSFDDGDAFHSASNKDKMAGGIPLTDEDRRPWLNAMREAIVAKLLADETAVFACSSLKRSYRAVLRGDQSADDVRFLYLQGSVDQLSTRLRGRTNHFFDPALLQSQLNELEEPRNGEALVLSIGLSPEAIVSEVTKLWGDVGMLAREIPVVVRQIPS